MWRQKETRKLFVILWTQSRIQVDASLVPDPWILIKRQLHLVCTHRISLTTFCFQIVTLSPCYSFTLNI